MEREADEISFDPTARTDASLDGAGLPELPDATEAKVWLLAEREGLPQTVIADRMNMTQSGVSKALARGSRKINDFIARGLITIDRLELELRRGVGLAPRT